MLSSSRKTFAYRRVIRFELADYQFSRLFVHFIFYDGELRHSVIELAPVSRGKSENERLF